MRPVRLCISRLGTKRYMPQAAPVAPRPASAWTLTDVAAFIGFPVVGVIIGTGAAASGP